MRERERRKNSVQPDKPNKCFRKSIMVFSKPDEIKMK